MEVQKKREFNKHLRIAKKMPPLYHTLPGEKFELEKSEVVKWLISQPDLLDFIFDRVKKHGHIIYNPETGKWHGVDYDEEDY